MTRLCQHDSCGTRLSAYNDEDYCWQHRHDADVPEPVKPPTARDMVMIRRAVQQAVNLEGVDPQDYVETLASAFGYSYGELTAPGRRPDLVNLRRVLALDLRWRGFSLPKIGRLLGRDHSTVVHMLKQGEARV